MTVLAFRDTATSHLRNALQIAAGYFGTTYSDPREAENDAIKAIAAMRDRVQAALEQLEGK